MCGAHLLHVSMSSAGGMTAEISPSPSPTPALLQALPLASAPSAVAPAALSGFSASLDGSAWCACRICAARLPASDWSAYTKHSRCGYATHRLRQARCRPHPDLHSAPHTSMTGAAASSFLLSALSPLRAPHVCRPAMHTVAQLKHCQPTRLPMVRLRAESATHLLSMVAQFSRRRGVSVPAGRLVCR